MATRIGLSLPRFVNDQYDASEMRRLVQEIEKLNRALQAEAEAASGVTASPGAFIATGSTDISTTVGTVALDTEVLDPDTNYSNSSGEITVTAAGYYHVDINIPINDDGSGGSARGRVFIVLQEDDGDGTWTDVDHIRGQDYARETSDGQGVHAAGIVLLTAGEAIRIRIDASSTVDVSTESGEASLSIHKVRDT